ncbi:hypothetical protein F4859DRAFT_477902 [Xylaria cf. heliscus]|nr:hypothetical protein F4859DRAFT_477902 [Xylaria cf. heliscus]
MLTFRVRGASSGNCENRRSPSDTSQHFIVSTSPPVCHCGTNFTRLSSLERHVQSNTGQLSPNYPCPECSTYQGKNGFVRKDHLKQHLRGVHQWDAGQLAILFPHSQSCMNEYPVCHFQECDYYRDPSFKNLGVHEQHANRPFDTQSQYTNHMKREHDWSPYPCKVTGCNKFKGAGFFSTTAFEKHYKEKHPGSAIPALKVQDRTTEAVECAYCGGNFKRGEVGSHQRTSCWGEAACGFCNKRMMSFCFGSHHCEGKINAFNV